MFFNRDNFKIELNLNKGFIDRLFEVGERVKIWLYNLSSTSILLKNRKKAVISYKTLEVIYRKFLPIIQCDIRNFQMEKNGPFR